MATLAKLVVKLVTDVSEFTKGLDSASKKLTKVGESMEKVGRGMTIGLTVPLVAAGTAAVKLASDLEESRNKANVVFGEMAQDVQKFASSAATDMGMTQNEALGFASTYGAMLKNMGLGADEVAKMSKALTTLTADYGSFHNLSAEEAFEKIKAGLVGSSEPLRALGKDLTVTAVQAYALANGIGSATGELTNSELALARYGLLLSQSKDEMGDFVNTSDGLANSSKILGALSKELMTSFGEELVPAVTDLINVLIPMLKKFNEMDPAIKKGIISFLMFVAAIGPVLSVGGRLLQVGGSITKMFGAKTAAAAAAGTATTNLGFSFAGLAAKLGLAGKGLAGVMSLLGAVIGPAIALGIAIAGLILVWKAYGTEFLESIKIIYNGFMDVIGALFKNAIDWGKRFREQGKSLMLGIVMGMAQGIYNGASAIWNALLNTIFKPFVFVIDEIKKLLKLSSPSKVFAGIGMNMMLGLAEGIEKYAPKSIDANINAVNEISSVSAGGIKSSGKSASISIGEIRIQGDLSESAKISLRKEIRNIFGQELKAVME
jgi:hypothetical protein